MKHRMTAILTALAAAVLIISLGGCAVNGESAEYRDPSVPIVVEKGQTFTIVLESDPSTGYQWRLEKELDGDILVLESVEYEEPEAGLPGSSGEERWTFKAQGLGRAEIVLGYARPWEEASAAGAAVQPAGKKGGDQAEEAAEAAEGEKAGREAEEESAAVTAPKEWSAPTSTEVSEVEGESEVKTLVFSVWVKKKGYMDKEPKKYKDPGEAIEVEEGLKFSVVLESNPTTGYQWELAKPLKGDVVALVGTAFEAKGGSEGGEGEKMGAPGEETWTFEALKPGEAEITLAYRRSWEKGAEKTVTFKVEVKAPEESSSEH